MDDQHTIGEPSRFPVAKPYRPSDDGATIRADFTPLRLVLLPTGLSIDLTEPDQIVGRHSSADVRLPLGDVSRRHCRLVFVDSSWHIIDLDSLNGTFVNNQRVRRAVLKHRDRVRIGSFLFEVQIIDRTMPRPLGETRRAS